MNTNEQLAVICLGIRDETEQRVRSPRNGWCLSAQWEPNTFNTRSMDLYTYSNLFHVLLLYLQFDVIFIFRYPSDAQAKKQLPFYIAPGEELFLI